MYPGGAESSGSSLGLFRIGLATQIEVGALELGEGSPGSAGQPETGAQLFADLIAPHLELIRRSALGGRPDLITTYRNR